MSRKIVHKFNPIFKFQIYDNVNDLIKVTAFDGFGNWGSCIMNTSLNKG